MKKDSFADFREKYLLVHEKTEAGKVVMMLRIKGNRGSVIMPKRPEKTEKSRTK